MISVLYRFTVFVILLTGILAYGQEMPDSVLTSDNKYISWNSVTDQEWTLLYFYRGNW